MPPPTALPLEMLVARASEIDPDFVYFILSISTVGIVGVIAIVFIIYECCCG